MYAISLLLASLSVAVAADNTFHIIGMQIESFHDTTCTAKVGSHDLDNTCHSTQEGFWSYSLSHGGAAGKRDISARGEGLEINGNECKIEFWATEGCSGKPLLAARPLEMMSSCKEVKQSDHQGMKERGLSAKDAARSWKVSCVKA